LAKISLTSTVRKVGFFVVFLALFLDSATVTAEEEESEEEEEEVEESEEEEGAEEVESGSC
jgi:hypothetical protein